MRHTDIEIIIHYDSAMLGFMCQNINPLNQVLMGFEDEAVGMED